MMRPFGSMVKTWISLASLPSANSTTSKPGGTLRPGAFAWASSLAVKRTKYRNAARFSRMVFFRRPLSGRMALAGRLTRKPSYHRPDLFRAEPIAVIAETLVALTVILVILEQRQQRRHDLVYRDQIFE